MENEKGKQSKLVKIESFKEGCISQGKVFSPELDSGLNLGFSRMIVRIILSYPLLIQNYIYNI
ncbi:hypothetical protein KAX97_03720 [candidate division WOR-3 bacterium]|nr:hypothetical protein [candidate division WOR-3 bacterium]